MFDGERRGLADANQPGGRRPAPGRLALVQAFINTHYDLGVAGGGEVLASTTALGAWFSGRGLLDADAAVDVDELQRVLELREGLRALAFANNAIGPPDPAALRGLDEGGGVEVRVAADGPSFVQARFDRVEGAIGVLVASTAEAMLEGRWRRMKACPGRHCGWVFYDRSRNGTGRWCSMAVCGGRAKARAYYERKKGPGHR
jgi:predicted RNA-binding Zn ribbon-like protein